MSSRAAISGLVAIAGVAAVVLWTRSEGEKPVVEVPVTPPPPVAPEAATVEVRYEAPPVARDPSPEDRRRMFKLPTGEYVPTLNGVLDAPALDWPIDVPFSPIVGRERDTRGNDWYVHADGSRSTNSMVYRSDIGRTDPSTQLARPTPALPMEQPPGSPGDEGSPRSGAGEGPKKSGGGTPGTGRGQ